MRASRARSPRSRRAPDASERPDPSDKAKNCTTTWFDMFRVEDGRIAGHRDGDTPDDKP